MRRYEPVPITAPYVVTPTTLPSFSVWIQSGWGNSEGHTFGFFAASVKNEGLIRIWA